MSVEEITENMRQENEVRWFTVFDGKDFWRVKKTGSSAKSLEVYDYPDMNRVYEHEVVQYARHEVFVWLNSQKNG